MEEKKNDNLIEKEVLLSQSPTFSNNNDVTLELLYKKTPFEPSLEGLRLIVATKYPELRDFERACELNRHRGRQILAGYKVPKNVKVIKKIAEVLNIDVVNLTQLFDKIRLNLKEQEK